MEKKMLKPFIHKIYNISSRVQQIRGMEIPLPNGVKINTAALSTLDVIYRNPERNMSEISILMGITKGAISQMVQKLEQKELVIKKKADNNAKNYFVTLTDQGIQVLEEYNTMHDKLYVGMYELLSQYQEDEIELLWNFLCETSEFVDEFKTEAVSTLSLEEKERCDQELLNQRRE